MDFKRVSWRVCMRFVCTRADTDGRDTSRDEQARWQRARIHTAVRTMSPRAWGLEPRTEPEVKCDTAVQLLLYAVW